MAKELKLTIDLVYLMYLFTVFPVQLFLCLNDAFEMSTWHVNVKLNEPCNLHVSEYAYATNSAWMYNNIHMH